MQNNKNKQVLEGEWKSQFIEGQQSQLLSIVSSIGNEGISNSAPTSFCSYICNVQTIKVEPVVSKRPGLNTLFNLLLDENLRENFLKRCGNTTFIKSYFFTTPLLSAEQLIQEIGCENGDKSF